MISRGATSVWERWDGIQPGGGPACPTMNSFNHYALGSMFRWAIEAVCGLRPADGAVAFREFSFARAVSRTLQWAASVSSARRVRSGCAGARAGEDLVEGEVTVPEGATCSVALEVPDGDRTLSLVTEGGGGPFGQGTHRVRWQA